MRLQELRALGLAAVAAVAFGVAGCMEQDSKTPLQPAHDEAALIATSHSGQRGIERAIEAQKKANAVLLNKLGIVGTGSTLNEEGLPAVLIFVEDSAMVAGLPDSVDGLPVIPEVTGKVYALEGSDDPPLPSPSCYEGSTTASTPRPVPIGVSAGIVGYSGGTYGVRVFDPQGNLYMLSNNHTFAGRNAAPIGTYAVQPRPADGGRFPADTVGNLADFEPLLFCRVELDASPGDWEQCPINIMDAAIVATTAALAGNATPCDGYGIPSGTPAEARNGLRIKKYGRTTGMTVATVHGVNVTVNVNFGTYSDGAYRIVRFENQIFTRHKGFSDSGDSGSLVVTDRGNEPVGLVFAGSATSTFINPIGPILERFNVSIDGI